jgi:chromosome partitioning protein
LLVVALCQTKGGSGKSTIAECLAVYAAKFGSVQLLDLDPQASSTKWWRRRGGPENPMLVTEIKSLPAFMATLQKRGGPDVLIIDTPGSMLGTIRDAIGVADVVIIPILPSVKDWEAMDVVESIVIRFGKRPRTLYLINRFRARTDTSTEALRALKERASNEPMTITLRTDHERAVAVGMTAPEINKDAAREIAAAWEAINRIAKNEQDQAITATAVYSA